MTPTFTNSPTYTASPTISPTPTITPTFTATPTVTPTPPVMQVTFKLTVHETPIAGAPIMINATTASTDVNGEISASLINSQAYTVTTGLEALSFAPLYDTGGGFAARSPVLIEAERLVTSIESPCRIVIDGLPNIYFSSVNSTDRTLTVPLTETLLNSIHSVTGGAVPGEAFAPGTSGFAVPESHFQDVDGLRGVWKFLGLEIPVTSALSVCVDRGVPGECMPIDSAVLRSPFEYTRTVVVKMARQAIAAAKSGRWKGSSGGFSIPFLSRGASALATMEKAFRDSKEQNFVCEIAPQSCVTKRVPKREMKAAFKKLFEGKVPKGLEHITARKNKELAAFERYLRTLPDTYTSCE